MFGIKQVPDQCSETEYKQKVAKIYAVRKQDGWVIDRVTVSGFVMFDDLSRDVYTEAGIGLTEDGEWRYYRYPPDTTFEQGSVEPTVMVEGDFDAALQAFKEDIGRQ